MSIINLSDSPPETPHRPSDCSLVVAIPLDREAFVADLTVGEKDYARNFARKRGALSTDGLWTVYEPYAASAIKVVEEVKRLGVEVVLNATRLNFCKQLGNRQVTTLIAHWRSARLTYSDIVAPADLIKRIRATERELADSVGSAGAELLSRVCEFSSPDENASRETIASILNLFLHTIPTSLDDNAKAGRVGGLTRQMSELENRRKHLDKLFQGMFRGGSSVEFYDGLYPAPAVVSDIPAEYAGILDLTVCNSILLGEAIRKKCERCLVLMNEETASPGFRFTLYKQIICSLDRQSQTYVQASVAIRKLIGARCS